MNVVATGGQGSSGKPDVCPCLDWKGRGIQSAIWSGVAQGTHLLRGNIDITGLSESPCRGERLARQCHAGISGFFDPHIPVMRASCPSDLSTFQIHGSNGHRRRGRVDKHDLGRSCETPDVQQHGFIIRGAHQAELLFREDLVQLAPFEDRQPPLL